MLYKVCMAETFAEEPDRVGIIQADTLVEAAEKLREWVDTLDWGDYSRVGETIVEVLDTSALIRCEATDPGFGLRGVDEFVITPISGDVFMFLVEDWPYMFGRLARHL